MRWYIPSGVMPVALAAVSTHEAMKMEMHSCREGEYVYLLLMVLSRVYTYNRVCTRIIKCKDTFYLQQAKEISTEFCYSLPFSFRFMQKTGRQMTIYTFQYMARLLLCIFNRQDPSEEKRESYRSVVQALLKNLVRFRSHGRDRH